MDSPVFKNKTPTKTAVGLVFQPLITRAVCTPGRAGRASFLGESVQLLLHVLHEGGEVLVHEAEADEGPQLAGAPGRVAARRGQLRPLPQHRLPMEGGTGALTSGTRTQPHPSAPGCWRIVELPVLDARGMPSAVISVCELVSDAQV